MQAIELIRLSGGDWAAHSRLYRVGCTGANRVTALIRLQTLLLAGDEIHPAPDTERGYYPLTKPGHYPYLKLNETFRPTLASEI